MFGFTAKYVTLQKLKMLQLSFHWDLVNSWQESCHAGSDTVTFSASYLELHHFVLKKKQNKTIMWKLFSCTWNLHNMHSKQVEYICKVSHKCAAVFLDVFLRYHWLILHNSDLSDFIWNSSEDWMKCWKQQLHGVVYSVGKTYTVFRTDWLLYNDLPSSYDTSEWISRSLHTVVFSASRTHKRKRPWARIDSDVWVICSVCQMNSDSMFITLLHTALHTHAVFKINKQPSFHLPLSWTKIDLTLQIHWLLGRNHTRLQSSLVGIITHIIQYQMKGKNK